MKFIASQKELIDALNIVSSVCTDRKSQLPILSNTLVSTIGNTVRFLSTDSMIFTCVIINASILDDGTSCMCAKDLLDRVRKMPNESKIKIDGEGNIASNDSYRIHHIPVMNHELFPQIQIPDNLEYSIVVPVSKIKSLIDKTWFAVSDDNSQPNIYNSYILFDESKIQMVSFDGYKLAVAEDEFTSKYNNLSIPYKSVMFIKRWLSKVNKDKDLKITKNHHGIYFGLDNTVYGFRIMDVNPPDYKKIFSIPYDNVIVIDKDELIDCLMSNMITDDRVSFSFDQTKKKCKVFCRCEDGKYTEDQISCKIKGDPPEFKLNGKFLLDSISSFSTDKVRIKLGKSKSDPIMVCEFGFKVVIAPMVD